MKWPFSRAKNRSGWDQAAADEFIGATVLVRITYNQPEGAEPSEFFGTVLSADRLDGITLRLEGNRAGEVYTLPPDLRSFFPAEEGSYRLRTTGEIVVDPDYTATWTINAPSH